MYLSQFVSLLASLSSEATGEWSKDKSATVIADTSWRSIFIQTAKCIKSVIFLKSVARYVGLPREIQSKLLRLFKIVL